MDRLYTDYVNKTAITIPDTFIDVKTGETYTVTPKLMEQIEYHAKNNTLIHLILSALDLYLHPKAMNGGNAEILYELAQIKTMMQQGYMPKNISSMKNSNSKHLPSRDLDLEEVKDVLEAFTG